MKTDETYYSDKLKAIINETFNYRLKFKDTWVVDKDKALSTAKKHLSFTNEIEKHIFNTIKKILNDANSKKHYFENNVFYHEFFDGICLSFINATMTAYMHANYMYTHFQKKLWDYLKLDGISIMNLTHLEKANAFADKFFVSSITLTLDDNQLNLHKNIYKKALLSSFHDGIAPSTFRDRFRFNIFKTYESELLSQV